MEKINTEILVSSLFTVGFDKVDGMLYTYTLGHISLDNQSLPLFHFEESETSDKFNEYVDYDGITFKLKEGITLNTNVGHNEEHPWPLGKALHTNKKLIEYLSKLDFREIVIKKVITLGIDKIADFPTLFSEKEKAIICEVFGINYKHDNKDDKPNRYIYSESAEVAKIVKDIQAKRKRRLAHEEQVPPNITK